MSAKILLIVSLTVWLGLASALVLKEAADRDLHAGLLVFVLGVVVAINATRFLLWGYVYRRHPVSITYPLGATFFPLVLLVDHFVYGAAITVPKVAASLLIMAGVSVLTSDASAKRVEASRG